MTMRKFSPPRVPMSRRLAVGTAWALAWMVAWAGALVLFAGRAQAAPIAAGAAMRLASPCACEGIARLESPCAA